MKQKKLIFNYFVNRNWKKLTDSRKRAKILADNRKSHHPIETLLLQGPVLHLIHSAHSWDPENFPETFPTEMKHRTPINKKNSGQEKEKTQP